MTVVALTRDYILDRLNSLPPQSRKRAGYCDLLREIRKRELQQYALARDFERALDKALSDPDFQRTMGLL